MGTLKVEGDDEIIERFKAEARRRYGQKRGSIKEATMKLIENYISRESAGWGELRGVIDEEGTAEELERKAWEKVD